MNAEINVSSREYQGTRQCIGKACGECLAASICMCIAVGSSACGACGQWEQGIASCGARGGRYGTGGIKGGVEREFIRLLLQCRWEVIIKW